MMLKVDEVKDGTTVKAFDYSFKSSSNQTYRIILSLIDNNTRFTINMTEKTEKLQFITEFATPERVNQCSKGLFNRIDIFYLIVLSIFEKNEADGKVTKDGIFQLVLPYSLMNNIVENMIIDVSLVENDEVWRLKQTILDLQESVAYLTPELITFDRKISNANVGQETKLFTHKSKKKGKVALRFETIKYPCVTFNSPAFEINIKIGDKSYNKLWSGQVLVDEWDGNTTIEAYAKCTSIHYPDPELKIRIIVTPAQEFNYI